jgi:MFS family permease
MGGSFALMGGLLVDHTSYRWIFWTGTVLALLSARRRAHAAFLVRWTLFRPRLPVFQGVAGVGRVSRIMAR